MRLYCHARRGVAKTVWIGAWVAFFVAVAVCFVNSWTQRKYRLLQGRGVTSRLKQLHTIQQLFLEKQLLDVNANGAYEFAPNFRYLRKAEPKWGETFFSSVTENPCLALYGDYCYELLSPTAYPDCEPGLAEKTWAICAWPRDCDKSGCGAYVVTQSGSMYMSGFQEARYEGRERPMRIEDVYGSPFREDSIPDGLAGMTLMK